MIILLDLYETLTDTAHEKFKPFNDGKEPTIISDILLIQGAREFIIESSNHSNEIVGRK